jgi:hypothetical protein
MKERLARLFGKPTFLIGLLALATALVVQPGEVGSVDTSRRLQTTRSFWTSAPAVKPGDLGLIGRNGHLYNWFGMGQSLVMLPGDILARTAIGFVSRFREPPAWFQEQTVVTYITSTLICVLAILVCYHFLSILGFTETQSILGAGSLLLGTTFLHYTQNMQENNLLLLLTLSGFYFQYGWLRTGSARSLRLGSMALGANLLTRLTTGLDLLAVTFFIFLCLKRRQDLKQRAIEYARIAFPCYAVFLIIDRAYQYERFGSPFTTYIGIFAEQFFGRFPITTAPGWPWSNPFWIGFLGPLITPQKSIFLFDPLIVLTLVLLGCLWRRLATDLRAFAIASACLLFTYIVFYARFYDWSGNSAWGDRYITTPVQMLAIIAIPLWMRYRPILKPWTIMLGKAIALSAVVVQIASVFFWHPLELRQASGGHHTFLIGLRFLNIIAVATGATDKWGLTNHSALLDQPGALNTPYFFPFLAMRRGAATGWKLMILFGVWGCLLAVTFGLLFLLATKTRRLQELESQRPV